MIGSHEIIKIAYDRGYRIINNEIFNPLNKKINGNVHNGYKNFGIRIFDMSTRNIPVHRLVAYQKYGDEIFKDEIQVRHLDGNSLNNIHGNIVIGSAYDNCMDKTEETRLYCSLIATSYVKIHDHKSVIEDRKKGMSYKDIMIKYNISSKGTVSYICNKSFDLKL